MSTKSLQKQSQSHAGFSVKSIFRSDNFGLIVALFAIILLFTLLNKNYFSMANLRNVFTSASLIGLIAVGEAILLIGGFMDLSPGSTAAFSGVLAALLLRAGVSFPVTILAVIALGILVGALNSFFITSLRISAFIVTLASQSIIRGLCYIFSNGESILITNSAFLKMGTLKVLGVIPFPIFFMVLIFLVFIVVLNRTRFGRNVYIVGGNADAARLAGISTRAITYMMFILMSVLASVGGMILAARMNTGQPQACQSLEFDGITAAILGGVAMSGGFGTLSGTFIGLLILQCFNNGLTAINVPSFWQYVARGGLMLAALSFDFLRSRKRKSL